MPDSRRSLSVLPRSRFLVRTSRRDVLRLGGLWGLTLSLPDLLRGQALQADSPHRSFGRARRVIMLYLHGGHAQQETFDPKPHGPSAVRGEFSAIATSVTGVRFCEHLPRTAALADRLSVVRSMSHPNANHVQAALPAQTGHAHPLALEALGDFPPSASDFPPVGAVLDAVRPASSTLPTWIRIGPLMRRANGTVLHGQSPGLLGETHASFVIDQSLLPRDVRVQAIEPNAELTTLRLAARRSLLSQFDAIRAGLEATEETANFDAFQQKAFGLLSSEATRRAFELSREAPATRARYGETEFGQRCLLARRLAEAGVPMVNVSYCHTPHGSWDTHGNHFREMQRNLSPTLDAAFTALVQDLEERGLLEETLVVVNAEFGRTPKINSASGRDHWPWCYTLVLAGGGARAGMVYGASDDQAAYPIENPHDPKDFVATIYHLLGVPPETVIHDSTGRAHTVIIGRPIEPIIG